MSIMSIEGRLLRNCIKTDYCWNWTAAIRNGYGRMIIGSRTDNSRHHESAHRMAYREWKGEIGDNFVLHHCDNKLCINPDHLYLGDHAQNMRDAVERKRFIPFPGELNGNASISNKTAMRIKGLLNTNITCREIAKIVNTTREVVKGISSGKSWNHIPEPPE